MEREMKWNARPQRKNIKWFSTA